MPCNLLGIVVGCVVCACRRIVCWLSVQSVRLNLYKRTRESEKEEREETERRYIAIAEHG
jgi:hypothetical protein